MKESKADVVLHSVRMCIIQTVVNKRQLAVQQIGEKLPDVPQASLYRQQRRQAQTHIDNDCGCWKN